MKSFMLFVCSLLMSGFALAAPVDKDECEWQAGHNPYTGDKAAAVDQLTHIPEAARTKIKAKMKQHVYDDMVEIHKDKIVSLYDYKGFAYTGRISNMRFGTNGRCKEVNRSKWSAGTKQFALVYSADGYSVIDPEVCRNIAQIYEAPAPVLPTLALLDPIDPIGPIIVPPIPEPSFQDIAGPILPPDEVLPPAFPPIILTEGPGRIYPITISPVPEPSTWVMFMAGLLVLWFRHSRRKTVRLITSFCPLINGPDAFVGAVKSSTI